MLLILLDHQTHLGGAASVLTTVFTHDTTRKFWFPRNSKTHGFCPKHVISKPQHNTGAHHTRATQQHTAAQHNTHGNGRAATQHWDTSRQGDTTTHQHTRYNTTARRNTQFFFYPKHTISNSNTTRQHTTQQSTWHTCHITPQHNTAENNTTQHTTLEAILSYVVLCYTTLRFPTLQT